MTSGLTSLVTVGLVLTTQLKLAVTFASFRNNIPNGYRVPDPCRPGRTAQGVGHINPDGGGLLNAFGRDYQKYRGEWSLFFCLDDSDGDGISNGAELGDPWCFWRPGRKPKTTKGITHPGRHNTLYRCPIPPWLWSLLFGWTVIFEDRNRHPLSSVEGLRTLEEE